MRVVGVVTGAPSAHTYVGGAPVIDVTSSLTVDGVVGTVAVVFVVDPALSVLFPVFPPLVLPSPGCAAAVVEGVVVVTVLDVAVVATVVAVSSVCFDELEHPAAVSATTPMATTTSFLPNGGRLPSIYGIPVLTSHEIPLSVPAPPTHLSLPAAPFKTSLPAPPDKMLFKVLPVRWSLPLPPTRFSELLIVSVPTPVFCAAPVARVTFTDPPAPA